MNKAIFSGRLTRDPELRRTNNGTAVCTASIAVDDGWGDRKNTYYPTVVLWRQSAEYLVQYAGKGDLIEVSARYTERSWEDRNGNKRTSVEFVADEVHILSKKGAGSGQGGATGSQASSCGQGAGYQYPGGSQAAQGPSDDQFEDLGDDPGDGELPF